MSQLSLLSNIIFPALQVMITLKGESDSSAADIFVKVGMINFRVGRLERAMPLLNKAVDIYREGGKEYESNLVSPLFVIGNIHKLLEQPKRARGVWSEAYELSTKYNGFKSDPLLNKVHLVLQQLIENSDDEEETMNEESKKTPPANTDTAPKSELVETSSDEAVQNKEKSKKKPPADTDIIETSSVEIETSSDKAAKKEEKSKKKSASTKSEKVDERNGNGDEVEKKKEKSKKKLPVDTDIVETSSDEKEKKKVKSKKKSKKKKSSADTQRPVVE